MSDVSVFVCYSLLHARLAQCVAVQAIASIAINLHPMITGISLQLYNVSTEPGRKEFLDKLFNFMQKKGENLLTFRRPCLVPFL